jgi:hypothetical protein
METAKEHAEELIEEVHYKDTRDGLVDAVRAAKVCVEKILEVLDHNEGHWKYQTTSWWREVLTEIDNYEV